MSSTAILAVFLQLTAPALPDTDRVHDDNVQAYANSDRYADILVNEQMLLDARAHLGLSAADGPTIVSVEDEMIRILERAIAEAPSPKAWCDATYRNYGPDGQILPGLMKR